MAQKTEGTQSSTRGRQNQVTDRFDRVPHSGRVGAHRVTVRPRYFWQYLIGALLGFALLTTIGIVAVQSIGSSGDLPIVGSPEATAAPEAKVAAKLDPDATVAILNGSSTKNLAAALDSIIAEEEWGKILFSGSAETTDVKISAVFFMDPADEAAAKGLAEKLGGISTYATQDYASYEARLVVLLGADYAGPGVEEAKTLTEDPEVAEEPATDPETGFAIDPATGNAVDPATGQQIDPATGFLIDPETGLPTDPATGLPVQ